MSARRHFLTFPAVRLLPAIVPILGLFLALFLGGCLEPSSIDDPEPPPFLVPRTSPANVLHNFRSIYNGADALMKTPADTLYWSGMFSSLFHPDSFRFYFLPWDQPTQLSQRWWGLEPEIRCFENMLSHTIAGTVDDIRLNWTVNHSDPEYSPGHSGWQEIYVTNVFLDVVTDGATYGVYNGAALFVFAPDPADSTLWVIARWVDWQPVCGAPVSEPTWGKLKLLFTSWPLIDVATLEDTP